MSKSVEEQIRAQQERLQKAEQRRARERRRLQRLQQQLSENERKRDTRRKILVGALVLEYADRMEEQGDATWQRWLDELLDQRLTQDDDRELFGLQPLPSEVTEGGAGADPSAQQSTEANLG
jgi:hypothetical protein